MAADLVVSTQVETSPGIFLELENVAGGYELESGAHASRDVSFREQVLDTPWTEGSVVITSVRENIIEPLNVWVSGPDHYTFDLRVKAVTDALEQLAFQVKRTVGNSLQTWNCLPSQYTIVTQQEYLMATTGLIRAQVRRYPSMTIVSV